MTISKNLGPSSNCSCASDCPCRSKNSATSRKREAIRRLYRDVLSAQVLVKLDEKENKVTPHEIMLLANMKLPSV